MWPLPSVSSRMVLSAAALSLACGVGWYITNNHWAKKYSARELAWNQQILDQINADEAERKRQEAISRETAIEFERYREEAAAALAAARGDTRTIRVCPNPNKALPVTSAPVRVADGATPGSGLSEGHTDGAGTVLDPQWLYAIGDEANTLRKQVLALQAEINRMAPRAN